MEEGVVNSLLKVSGSLLCQGGAGRDGCCSLAHGSKAGGIKPSETLGYRCAIQLLRSTFLCFPALQGPLGELFDTRQLLTDVSGSGNNWAHGHSLYGPQYAEGLAECVRTQVEACDSLQVRTQGCTPTQLL